MPHLCGTVGSELEYAAGDGWKCNRLQAVLMQAGAVGRAQQLACFCISF